MSTIQPDIHFFHKLADLAEKETMSRFRTNDRVNIETKTHDLFLFDPVTEADKEAEKVMRALIHQTFADHQVTGEEFGTTGNSDWEWVLDPVDGTRPFICGLPVWGTLIGLYHKGIAQMGMMAQPVTKERFWSDGKTAWYQGPQYNRVLQTSSVSDVSAAILHTTSPEPISKYPEIRFDRLNEAVKMTRYGGECYAMAMLAAGHIDICLEYALKPYDIAAFIPIIETAGGIVTTLSGDRPEQGGIIVASANASLHQQVLSILNSQKTLVHP
ncbi:histidinol-phosphatase [Leeia sp. TBRC 13508]|uniref:Histidinol-phosphatase n=1 Tax=Leeia speluncae TaxID=2884804 RepID=A0ABS8D8B4_9NEIS|nr:histidinol-phosphatase [Leeia speluncae]MCB6184440.1 histidinol-phosphatase [Leeia speluncae]